MEFEYVNQIKESLSVMEWVRLQYLIIPLEGIHLTEEQVKMLAWIAGCEPETIENLTEIFIKCRTEGR